MIDSDIFSEHTDKFRLSEIIDPFIKDNLFFKD